MALIRKFGTSIVQCLRLLSKEGIIHCDLKPVSGSLQKTSAKRLKACSVCSAASDPHALGDRIRQLGNGCFLLQSLW